MSHLIHLAQQQKHTTPTPPTTTTTTTMTTTPTTTITTTTTETATEAAAAQHKPTSQQGQLRPATFQTCGVGDTPIHYSSFASTANTRS